MNEQEYIKTPDGLIFLDSQAIFEWAIENNHLTKDPASENYAGNWMYMYSTTDAHWFKNIISRDYKKIVNP